MTPGGREAVRANYWEGISAGNAAFETDAPDWETWDKGRRADCRLVARPAVEVVNWAALSLVSSRPDYAGVAEVRLSVSASARGQGVGKALMTASAMQAFCRKHDIRPYRPTVGTRDCKDRLYVLAVVHVVTGVLHANTLEGPADAERRTGRSETRGCRRRSPLTCGTSGGCIRRRGMNGWC